MKNEFIEIHSQLNKIRKELSQLLTTREDAIVNEIIQLLFLLGKRINSTSVSSEQEVNSLQNMMNENFDYFQKELYYNIDLLIAEYNQVISLYEEKLNICNQFSLNEKNFLFVKRNKEFSFISENEEIINQIKVILKEKPSVKGIIFIGLGTGMIVDYLNNKFKTLVVDPFFVKEETRFEYLSSETDRFENEFRNKLHGFIGVDVEIIVHPSYSNFPESYLVLEKIRNVLSTFKMDVDTLTFHSESWFIESLKNINYLQERAQSIVNIDKLRNYHSNSHALIISGGPSFEEAIPHLKKVRNNYYIISIGQTLKSLLDNNIVPDYVVSIDASEGNSVFFKNQSYNIPLIFSLQLNHDVLNKFNGILIPYAETELSKKLLTYTRNSFTQHSTVAASALMVANYLGFKSIGLIGQDLALRNNEYYSSSVFKHSGKEKDNVEITYEIKLNNGLFGKTTRSLMAFKINIEEFVETNVKKNVEIYNLSYRGAKIKNIPYRSYDYLRNEKNEKNEKNKHILKNKYVSDNQSREFNNSTEQIYNSLLEVSKLINFHISNYHSLKNNFDYNNIINSWNEIIQNKAFQSYIFPMKAPKVLSVKNKAELIISRKMLSKDKEEVVKDIFNTLKEIDTFIEKVISHRNTK